MEKLSREQAINAVGLHLVEQVESLNCEPTGRLIYPAFEPEHENMQEYTASVENDSARITAYYFQKDEDLENCDNTGSLDWEIEYYEVEEL